MKSLGVWCGPWTDTSTPTTRFLLLVRKPLYILLEAGMTDGQLGSAEQELPGWKGAPLPPASCHGPAKGTGIQTNPVLSCDTELTLSQRLLTFLCARDRTGRDQLSSLSWSLEVLLGEAVGHQPRLLV